jgi:hypothetical protein
MIAQGYMQSELISNAALGVRQQLAAGFRDAAGSATSGLGML